MRIQTKATTKTESIAAEKTKKQNTTGTNSPILFYFLNFVRNVRFTTSQFTISMGKSLLICIRSFGCCLCDIGKCHIVA